VGKIDIDAQYIRRQLRFHPQAQYTERSHLAQASMRFAQFLRPFSGKLVQVTLPVVFVKKL